MNVLELDEESFSDFLLKEICKILFAHWSFGGFLSWHFSQDGKHCAGVFGFSCLVASVFHS